VSVHHRLRLQCLTFCGPCHTRRGGRAQRLSDRRTRRLRFRLHEDEWRGSIPHCARPLCVQVRAKPHGWHFPGPAVWEGRGVDALLLQEQWRGLQAEGKEAEKSKWPYLINNGRTNHVWQNAYLDQQDDFVMDRGPCPFINRAGIFCPPDSSPDLCRAVAAERRTNLSCAHSSLRALTTRSRWLGLVAHACNGTGPTSSIVAFAANEMRSPHLGPSSDRRSCHDLDRAVMAFPHA